METKSNKIKVKNIFYIIFFLLFFTVIFYISGLVGLLSMILSIIVYSLLFYFIYYMWNKIRKKEMLSFDKYLNYFLYKISIFFIIIISIIGGLSYYSNEISPAKVPTYTLSNGDKKIIFQTMSHIGTKEFYQKIKYNLINAKKNGYVYYYEGVRDGSLQNKEKFNEAIGIKFDKDLYSNFSKLYGVTNQDNSIYYNLVNNLDFNVDLSIDEIMEFYKKSPIENNKNNLLKSKEIIDINTEIIKTLSSLNSKELKILRYINKAMLNFLISSETIQSTISNNFGNKKLFSIIIGERDKKLSNEIINSKHKKVYITYGLLHFKGVFKLLVENDANWEIVKTDYLHPIK